ncbi:hypothetical protein B0H13DRAFT_1916839 [Mycena leptocephala]|nr:hypothetical protein B0H13DRAFT_1916839 [Mycena leptocephala]
MMARAVFSAVTADGEAGISAVTADGLVLPHLVLFFDRADSEHDANMMVRDFFSDGEAVIISAVTADGLVLPHLVLFFDRTVPWQPSVSVTQTLDEEEEEDLSTAQSLRKHKHKCAPKHRMKKLGRWAWPVPSRSPEKGEKLVAEHISKRPRGMQDTCAVSCSVIGLAFGQVLRSGLGKPSDGFGLKPAEPWLNTLQRRTEFQGTRLCIKYLEFRRENELEQFVRIVGETKPTKRDFLFLFTGDTPLARESVLCKIEPKPQASRSRQGLMAFKPPQAGADQAGAEP